MNFDFDELDLEELHELLIATAEEISKRRDGRSTSPPKHIPWPPYDWNWPTPPTPPIEVCPTCGIRLAKVMNMVCSNSKCPVGLGPILCGDNGDDTGGFNTC